MDEKRNAPTGAATSAGAAAEKAAGNTSIPVFNCNTTTVDRQAGKISRLLLHGEENAISGPELARIAGVTPRTLRLMVDRERLQYPICASDFGYFLPDSGNKGALELQRFLRRMDSRCRANRKVTKSARAALKAYQHSQIAGQESMWDGGGD